VVECNIHALTHSTKLSQITGHRVKVKKIGKAVPLHAMEAFGGRGDIALLILDLGTRWG
jgi:hypothetical protein